jgi:hypothetical protein
LIFGVACVLKADNTLYAGALLPRADTARFAGIPDGVN